MDTATQNMFLELQALRVENEMLKQKFAYKHKEIITLMMGKSATEVIALLNGKSEEEIIALLRGKTRYFH